MSNNVPILKNFPWVITVVKRRRKIDVVDMDGSVRFTPRLLSSPKVVNNRGDGVARIVMPGEVHPLHMEGGTILLVVVL